MTDQDTAARIAALEARVTELERERATLLESENRLRTILDILPVGVWFTDAVGKIVLGNPAGQRIWGGARWVGLDQYGEYKGWWAGTGERIRGDEWALARALRGETHLDEAVDIECFDGSRRTILNSGVPVRDAGGAIVGAVVLNVDISEQKRTERRLQEAMERLRFHSDNSPLAVVEWSADYRVTVWNAAAERMFGWSAAEAVGKGMDELRLVHPDDVRAVEAISAAMARGSSPSNVHPNRNVRKDGEVIHCEWYNSALHDRSGKLLSVLSLVLDVSARKRAEEGFRESDRRKSEFLAILSHELRNPLAPIRNSIALLDRAPPGDAAAPRALEVLDRQTRHLTRLVDDLLDMTRITHGKVELQLARIDARDPVRRACDDLRSLFEQRGIKLDVGRTADPLWVDADAERLTQIVGNLLNNALKFTQPGGSVHVSTRKREGECEVSVRDDGMGIDPPELEAIFQPFVQGERARCGGHGGLGIGLALVKELAVRHGGDVRAASGGPGKGSEFVVRLPAASPPADAAVGGPARPGAPGLRILIVEDNLDAGASLAELLALSGHAVKVVTRGRAGIDAAATDVPDVLISDVGLPDLSGLDVIRAVRSACAGRRPFAIALTGLAQPQDRELALKAGFDAHLPKPPPLEALEELLATVAKRGG